MKKIARFANGALIGYHLCKPERVIPTNFCVVWKRDQCAEYGPAF